eukprot:COSAG04_NODE_809_length_10142_cov_3.378174_14_plen_84_part_00
MHKAAQVSHACKLKSPPAVAVLSFALEGAPEQHVQNVHPVMATHTEMAGTKWTVRHHQNQTEADFFQDHLRSFLCYFWTLSLS